MSKDFVKYKDDTLCIYYSDYGIENRNYDCLFDFLGEYDIITASELEQDIIIMSNEVFLFTNQDEGMLARKGFVDLSRISSLKEFIDVKNDRHLNFVNWYYS